MKRIPSRSVNIAVAVLYCFFAVAPACGVSALEPDSRRSPADDGCARRTSYARAERRDTLEAYAPVLQTAGRRTTLTVGGRKYGESILLVSARGWMLRRDIRFDGDTYTLTPPDAQQRRSAKKVPALPGGTSTPRTKAGVALGDSFAKVSRLFGNVKSTRHCGLPELAFAGPGRFGDWFAIYRADARGNVIFLQTGEVANGIRHLWQ
jgi:hypothetical protein